MNNRLKKHLGLTVGALWLAASLPVSADVIYDNSVNNLNQRFSPGYLEVGDEITLAGTMRYLTNFSFEYWGTNTLSPGNLNFSGNVQVRVRFYLQDGTPYNGYATPGTLFFDSTFLPIVPTPRSTLNFNAGAGLDFPVGGLFMPLGVGVSNMTWSVQFIGMNPSDSVGVDLYSPPTVGGNYSDYWQNTGVGGWSLMTNSAGAIDFAAEMQAAPEPSSLLLGLLGGMGMLLGVGRLRRRP